MHSSQLIAILQIVAMTLCTAVSFGLLLSTMMVRGKLYAVGPEAARHDVVFTEKAYLASSIFCAVGALAAINFNWATFCAFMCLAAALHLADQKLLPAMREAAEAGLPLPHTATRGRFELTAALMLFFVFWSTAVPPLIRLATTFGIG